MNKENNKYPIKPNPAALGAVCYKVFKLICSGTIELTFEQMVPLVRQIRR